MTRSPNYGRRTRPPHARRLYLRDAAFHSDGTLTVTCQEPGRPAFAFPARDQGGALTMMELLRQGAFSVPVNGASDA